MKKIILALIACAATTAPVMADIVVGGQLEVDLVSASGDGTTEGIQLSDAWEGGSPNRGFGSHFFVKGSHKLSDNLTGIWKLNTLPKWDKQANGDKFSLDRRDVFVGIKGGFGTVLLGRLNSPYKSSTVKWDPFLATFMQARGNEGVSAAGHNGYVENVIAYANTFGAVTFVGAVGLDESNESPADNDTDGDHAITFSLNMPLGPVELALGYLDTSGIGAGVDGTTNIEAIKLGVKYNAGPLTIAGQYETIDIGGNDAFDQIYGTASYKLGNGSNVVSLGVGQGSPDASSAEDSQYIALGLKHSYSKNLSMLVGVTKTENSGFVDGRDYTLFGISTRVKF